MVWRNALSGGTALPLSNLFLLQIGKKLDMRAVKGTPTVAEQIPPVPVAG